MTDDLNRDMARMQLMLGTDFFDETVKPPLLDDGVEFKLGMTVYMPDEDFTAYPTSADTHELRLVPLSMPGWPLRAIWSLGKQTDPFFGKDLRSFSSTRRAAMQLAIKRKQQAKAGYQRAIDGWNSEIAVLEEQIAAITTEGE